MFQRVLPVVLMASLVAPVAAQAPAGWKVHIDRSTNAQDPDDKSGVTFMSMGKAFHVSGGPAGTYAKRATGERQWRITTAVASTRTMAWSSAVPTARP